MLVQTPQLDCSPLGDARRLAPHRSRTRGKAFSDQFDSWDLAVNRPAISCHPWPLDNEAVREPAPNEEPRSTPSERSAGAKHSQIFAAS
jgi:hypothetical protein